MKRFIVLVFVILVVSINCFAGQEDRIAPGDIADFTAFDGKKIELEWTAVGDDGTAGRVCYYEIRCAGDKSFDFKRKWDMAELSRKVRARKKNGKMEKVVIRKPKKDITRYYAIRAFDDAGNMSKVSNVSASGKDNKKAGLYMKRANKLFYKQKKDYKSAVGYYIKARESGAKVKNVDLLFKIAFCYKKLKRKESQFYFDRHLENQQYYYMINGEPYSSKNFNLEKYDDFLAGISFLGPAFTEPKKKEETVMYVPDKWVQKYRKQGIYLFLFYVVDYAYCYGDFPKGFVSQLENELAAVEAGTSKLTGAYVYTAIAAHYMFIRKYKQALEYYRLADSIEGNEEEYARSLKQVIEKVEKIVK